MRKSATVRNRPQRCAGSDLKSAYREALSRTGELEPLGRDRLLADIRIQVEHSGEYVAFIDRIKTVRHVRRMSRDVLAHGASLQDVQNAVDSVSEREQSRIVIAYIDGHGDEPDCPIEIPGR